MRLRDLRWYILSCIILIIAYAAIALLCYNNMVKSKVRTSMAELGTEASKSFSEVATASVNSLYDTYQEVGSETYYTITASEVVLSPDTFVENTYYVVDGNNYVLATEFSDGVKYYTIASSKANDNIKEEEFNAGVYYVMDGTSYIRDTSFSLFRRVIITAPESKFEGILGRKIILARYKDFATGISSTNVDYYFFFLRTTDVHNYECSAVPLVNVVDATLDTTKNEYVYLTMIFNSDGIIYTYSMDELASGSLIKSKLGSKFDVNNLIKEDANLVWDINGSTYVITAKPLFSAYVATFIPIDSAYFSIDWINGQLAVFYIIGIVLLIAMLVILILGCRKSSQLLRVDRHSLEATKSVVIRIDMDGKVIFTNKTFKQLYGIVKLENVESFIDVDKGEPILETAKENRPFECSLPKNDGSGELFYFQFTPIKILSSIYLMGSEITDDYNRRKYLYLMNGRNEITNIDNNFSFVNDYTTLVKNAGTYDLAFVQYNICKHEEIVAVFGRTNFNTLLNEFVNIVHDAYEGMRIYQLNDDKFIVVVPNSELSEVTEKIDASLDILRRPIQIKQNHIYVKVKVTIYNLKNGTEGVTVEEIKQKLDLAYRNIADFSTKDFIVYEPAMDGVIEAADEMEKDLVNGLANDEFRMYLQPQFDVIHNRIDGFESLIRWSNPKYFDKSPQAFVELAEQRGYILDIGRYVIKETFRLAKLLEDWNVHISMNVSPIQLLQVGFVQQIIDEYKSLKLKPGSIAIEITETFLMGNFQLMKEKLRRLKEEGFQIHLDDFCTGYSSMLYLKDLPVDTLKIDKEFTKFVTNNKVHSSIVKTICELGSSLDMDIICEGVETEEQKETVKKFGARLIQGFLISKAVPYEQALDLLDKYNTKKR